MIALTGNSPLWNGKRAHNHSNEALLSYRSQVQLNYGAIFGMNGAEYLYPQFLLDPKANFESVVRGYLDLPLDRTIIGGKKDYCGQMTMTEYLRDGIRRGEQVFFPDEAALTMMLREPMADVRFAMTGSAPRVEARDHDSVCQPVAVALDACYRGILANLDEVQKLMNGLEIEEIRNQRQLVCVEGLAAPVRHADPSIRTQRDLAIRLLGFAEDGLIERGLGEQQLLAPLFVIAETGINPAQRMMEAWENSKGSRQVFFQAIGYAQQKFADGYAFQWPQHIPAGHIGRAGIATFDAVSA
jgi:gamma-glutamylcysteine synthetase